MHMCSLLLSFVDNIVYALSPHKEQLKEIISQ